jgi:hypothetical protein
MYGIEVEVFVDYSKVSWLLCVPLCTERTAPPRPLATWQSVTCIRGIVIMGAACRQAEGLYLP